MNDSLEVLKQIYKPYRYTIKGKTTILETTSGDFVVKQKNQKIKNLYEYLKSRNFDYFPNLIDNTRNDVDVFEYVNEIEMPIEQKANDLIELMSLLHNKTAYYKEVSEDTYKEIYENIKNNIIDLQNYYNDLYEIYFLQEFMAPSAYLLMRNISKIFSALNFCQDEVDNWYDLVKDEKKQRVSLIHNNLELNHFLKDRQGYLISWDKAKIDTPVLDFVNFYKKEFFNLNFEPLFKKYLEKFQFNAAEKKLFFILISLPAKLNIENDEFENVKIIRNFLDYVMKTENLIRPYYAKEEKE